MKDEVLQEVWKAKDDLAARHNYDVRRLAEALKAKEGTSGHVILDLHAREKDRRALHQTEQ
jgi:hypothetical protein